MAIWEYRNCAEGAEAIETGLSLSACPFCNMSLVLVTDERRDLYATMAAGEWAYCLTHVSACPLCGWWKSSKHQFTCHFHRGAFERENLYFGAVATLRNLDLTDLSLPLDDVRKYLLVRYQNRFSINPQLFEHTVASVFRNLGYYVRVTAYSGDGGIDVILSGKGDRDIGVQVKRYKDSISVEQIRSLAGALFLEGLTRGVFVTTSRFQSGAPETVRKASLRGIRIDLVDASSFYSALQLSQANDTSGIAEIAERIDHISYTTRHWDKKW